jgi:rfaE bifunctional protein kinase chain/domain
MLTHAIIEQILAGAPRRTIAVVGDLFLDRYLDIDSTLTEPSLETGLDAFQVTQVRAMPGAAGTVINNLAALGAGRIVPIAIIGDDGEGYELRQALGKLHAVDPTFVTSCESRRTPTYTKPMLLSPGHPTRELNRLDIKNRTPTPAAAENAILDALETIWPAADAIIVLDQVSLPDTGVVTARVRDRVAQLGRADLGKCVLADSREHIDRFRDVIVKPNRLECERLCNQRGPDAWLEGARCLGALTGRAVVCTLGDEGMAIVNPTNVRPLIVSAYRVTGPIDIVGAGDSSSAAIVTALAEGIDFESAAGFGNLVASITIQQLGTTGTASPEQIRRRWREVES